LNLPNPGRLQAANPEFFYENLDEYLQEQYRAILNRCHADRWRREWLPA
jgi:hypothetical protein